MTPRSLVTTRITKRALQFPEVDLAPMDTDCLDQRDAALARAIEQAIARRWLTLKVVIESQIDRDFVSMQPHLQASLLVGSAQLLLLEKLPDHAVINEAVESSKSKLGKGAAGFTNAVLRKVADLRSEIVETHDPGRCDELPLNDGRAWRLNKNIFDKEVDIRLAQQTAHPPALITQWKKQLGTNCYADIARHSIVHPPILITGLDSEYPNCKPHSQSSFMVFTGNLNELQKLLGCNPNARVQDPAAALAVKATADLQLSTIIDACAGKGTKTKQLHQQHPHAQIIASDTYKTRLDSLRELSNKSPWLKITETGKLSEFAGRADLLLLDVPCSNTAVLARRPEAKYRFSRKSIEQLTSIQRQIAADYLPLLANAGYLLYSTCSLVAKENRAQVDWIMKWHGFKLINEGFHLPKGQPGDDPAEYTDGGYFALLQKQA